MNKQARKSLNGLDLQTKFNYIEPHAPKAAMYVRWCGPDTPKKAGWSQLGHLVKADMKTGPLPDFDTWWDASEYS